MQSLPKQVYALVKKIPYGKVVSYGQIAHLIGMPRHSRHVGNALANMPATMKIPWHRVINSAGRISLRRRHWDSGSDDLQRVLLEAEGVTFSSSGAVDFKRFGWQPAVGVKKPALTLPKRPLKRPS